ncbi:MAG: tyrosine-type recombinase/integrase [Ruminobacter sp.]|nr:tyrosine-type recombinase/integrase [Ruminobacter sp.]
MITNKIINQKIKQAIAEKRQISLGCGNHTVLDIKPSSKAYFYVRLHVNGIEKRKKIGEYPKMSVIEATRKSLELTDFIQGEYYPTFKEAKETYLEKKKHENITPKYLKSIVTNLEHLSILDKYLISEIYPIVVINEFIEMDNVTDCVKFKCLQLLKQVLNYCVLIYENYSYNRILPLITSPESPIKNPKCNGFPTCPPNKLKKYFFDRLEYTDEKYKYFILFLSLTVLRISSAASIKWSWVNFEEKKIFIPGTFMKTRKDHVVPITIQLEKLLKSLMKNRNLESEYVFTSKKDPNKHIHPSHIELMIATVCEHKICAHGLRKVCATYLASIGCDYRAYETLLAHEVKGTIEGIYNHYDYFKEKMEAAILWNNYIESILPANFKKLLK